MGKLIKYLEIIPIIGVFIQSENILIKFFGIMALISAIIGIICIFKKIVKIFK